MRSAAVLWRTKSAALVLSSGPRGRPTGPRSAHPLLAVIPLVVVLATIVGAGYASPAHARDRDIKTFEGAGPEYWNRPPPRHGTHHIIVQAMDWTTAIRHKGRAYKILERRLHLLRNMGFTIVLLPPISKSPDWAPQGYPPLDLRNWNSEYGTERELRSLIQTGRAMGLAFMGDVLHSFNAVQTQAILKRQEREGWLGGEHQCWRGPDVDPLPYGLPPQAVDARTARPEVVEQYALQEGDPRVALPRESPGFVRFLANHPAVLEVRQDNILAMQEDLGIDHFRMDHAKGRAPDAIRREADLIRRRNPNALVVAEKWDDSPDLENPGSQRDIIGPYGMEADTAVFDTAAKHALNMALSGRYTVLAHEPPGWERTGQRELPGVNGMEKYKRWAVTYAENHDTGWSPHYIDTDGIEHGGQERWPIPADSALEANALLLMSSGIPAVYGTHLFECGPEVLNGIASLLQVRTRLGVEACSPVEILNAVDNKPTEHGPCCGYYAHRIDGKQGSAILKIGPSFAFEPDSRSWRKATSGRNFAVWVDEAGEYALEDLLRNPKANGFHRRRSVDLLDSLQLDLGH